MGEQCSVCGRSDRHVDGCEKKQLDDLRGSLMAPCRHGVGCRSVGCRGVAAPTPHPLDAAVAGLMALATDVAPVSLCIYRDGTVRISAPRAWPEDAIAHLTDPALPLPSVALAALRGGK